MQTEGEKKVKLPCPCQLALAAVSLFGHIAPGQREPVRVDSLWIIPFIPADFQFTKEMLLCGAVLLLIVCRLACTTPHSTEVRLH